MAGPKECSQGEIEKNIKPAEATQRKFGAVEVVLTERVDNVDGTIKTIKFSVRGDGSGKTYEAEWGNTEQMWAPCPSTFSSLARPGDWGRLYLSAQFLHDNQLVAEPKWPALLRATIPPSEELEIYPLKLELTGIEMKSGRFRTGTVELLDLASAAPSQRIELDGTSPVRVRLTQAVFTSVFRLPFVPSGTAIKAALAVLNNRAGRTPPELAEAWSVLAAAMASVASGESFDEKLPQGAQEQIYKLFSNAG